VFSDITMLLLPCVKLWLLLAVRHPHTLKMPSWMPDWSGNSEPHVMWSLGKVPQANSKKEFKVCQLKCLDRGCNGHRDMLRVWGVQFSRISHLGAPFDFEGAEELCLEAVRHVQELEMPDQPGRARHNCGNSCRSILSPLILEGEWTIVLSSTSRLYIATDMNELALRHLSHSSRGLLLSRNYFGFVSHLR
jgi:hypothetical protein